MIRVKRTLLITDFADGNFSARIRHDQKNKNKIKETLKYNKSWESKIGNQTKIRRKKDESSIGTLSWTGK